MTPDYIDHTNAGQTVTIDDPARAAWLLAEGYISEPDGSPDDERGIYQTSEPASGDITLAENREKPVPPSKIEPHLANEGDEGDQGETVHGTHMGLDKEPAAGAPDVEVKTGDEFDALDRDALKERVTADREAKVPTA